MPEEGAHDTIVGSHGHTNKAFENDENGSNESAVAHSRRRRFGTHNDPTANVKPSAVDITSTYYPSSVTVGNETGRENHHNQPQQQISTDSSRKTSLSVIQSADAPQSDHGNRSRSPSRKVSISPSPPAVSQDDGKVERKISTNSSIATPPKSILVNGESVPNITPAFDGTFYESYKGSSYAERRDQPAESWWFTLCTRCRQKETGPGWEPNYWQSFCPYPFCPTYRHFSRVFCLFLLGFLAWGVLYSIADDDAAPGGQLFNIAVLCIACNFGGWILFRLISFPPLVGMLLTGMLWQNVGLIDIQGGYASFCSVLRKIALVVILTRAGLDLEEKIMRKLLWSVLRLALIPWVIDCVVVAVMSIYILNLPVIWAFLLGSVIAAVSPAVVVPALIKYRNKGYGVAKGIPTIVIAVSGIDDAVSVSVYGILKSILFDSNSLAFNILLAPLSVFVGLLFGVVWGFLSYYVPEKDDPYVVPMRLLLLLGGGLVAVFGSEHIGIDGAGPLGVVAASFFSCVAYTKTGWEMEDNPVATGFEIIWMIFEPILFGLTGTQIKFDEMDGIFVAEAIGILFVSIVVRIGATVVSGYGTILNMREKIFCGLAWMSKASVQAALAPVAYEIVKDWEGDAPEWGQTVMLTCILSILIAAPIGAIIIAAFGKVFLTKTEEAPPPATGWRRSTRPSLRDITIGRDGDDLSLDGRRSKRSSIVSNAAVVGGGA